MKDFFVVYEGDWYKKRRNIRRLWGLEISCG